MKLKSGLKPYKWHDHRDYDAIKSFGATVPAQFSLSFDVDANIWMPNQNEPQSFPGIPNTPALEEGCTSYSQTDLCMDEDLVQLDPMLIEGVTHANSRGGSDIKTALEAARKVFNRTAYFNIKKTDGLDWYDSFRVVLMSTPEEKRALSIGIPWYSSFEHPDTQGVLPSFIPGEPFTWHNAVVVGWDARGLKVKPWCGPEYGDRGFVYMPRALVNQLMDISGTCAFTVSKIAPSQVFTIDLSYIQKFVSILLNLWGNLTTPAVAPIIAQDESTPIVPSTVPTIATEPNPAPSAKVDLLTVFVNELKAMEGWYPGSTSYTCNNPGNLRCGPNKSQWNVLASGAKGGFCVFKDATTGMQALRNVTMAQCKGTSPTYNAAAKKLGLANSGELNLFQYFQVRDPAQDKNDPNALAVRFGKVLNCDPSTFKIKQLLS